MKTHILLIVHDLDELTMFVDALNMTSLDYKCTWAKGGEQALSQLLYLSPDLIFLNSNLPGTNEIELFSAIRKMPMHFDTKIILFSRDMPADAIRHGMPMTPADCVQRPGNTWELAEILDRILREEPVTH